MDANPNGEDHAKRGHSYQNAFHMLVSPFRVTGAGTPYQTERDTGPLDIKTQDYAGSFPAVPHVGIAAHRAARQARVRDSRLAS